jgi:flagellar assembly protein FliH
MTNKKPTLSEEEIERSDTAAPVSAFVYNPAPGWAAPRESSGESAGAGTAVARNPESARSPSAAISAEELRAREKQSREQGFQEGLARAQADGEAAIQQLKDAIAESLRGFSREREEYFHRVEGEVISLALAIVRKILRREAQVDPLLLTGMVRVALEKMAVSQNVRMRVHPSQIFIWRDYFAQQTDLPVTPELSGDPTLAQNQCQIETEFGHSDLNLESQLKEIEQGLFDLIAQRPAPR